LQVIRISSRLQRLVRTFYLSLPSLQNIGMFLLLILYIYAGIGTHLFSKVPITSDHPSILLRQTTCLARFFYADHPVSPAC
jgi:hypothetical protein